MASLFGDNQGSFRGELDEATRALEEFSRAARQAARGRGTQSRGAGGGGAGSGGAAGGRRFGAMARGALAGGLLAAGAFAIRTARTASLRGDTFQQQAQADIARLGSRFDPRLQNRIEPIDRAADRVASITENIARFGGQVSDEQRQRMFDVFNKQEGRVQAERNAIARLANAGVAQAGRGTPGVAEAQKAIELLQQIQDALANLVRNG